MTDKKNQPAEKTRLSWSWLRMALSLREKVKLGDKVNLEVDTMARYVARRPRGITELGAYAAAVAAIGASGLDPGGCRAT